MVLWLAPSFLFPVLFLIRNPNCSGEEEPPGLNWGHKGVPLIWFSWHFNLSLFSDALWGRVYLSLDLESDQGDFWCAFSFPLYSTQKVTSRADWNPDLNSKSCGPRWAEVLENTLSIPEPSLAMQGWSSSAAQASRKLTLWALSWQGEISIVGKHLFCES